MTRQTAHIHLTIATILALLVVGLGAAPASAAPQRYAKAERYALKLTNCLRTGGKVTRAGKCKGFGSGKYSKYRPPLKRSRKVSDNVSLPWARTTVRANLCGHTLAGSTVDSRFRKAGLKSIDNGENIGCGESWTPRHMVIWVIRWWQREKAYKGWHWRQLKDPDFKVAGVAVVKHHNGRTRLVVDFYGKTVK